MKTITTHSHPEALEGMTQNPPHMFRESQHDPYYFILYYFLFKY